MRSNIRKRFVQKVQSNVILNQIQLAGKIYSIIRSWGPERIETGWWRGPCVRRDYYRVELDDGQWWWIFQLFQRVKQPIDVLVDAPWLL